MSQICKSIHQVQILLLRSSGYKLTYSRQLEAQVINEEPVKLVKEVPRIKKVDLSQSVLPTKNDRPVNQFPSKAKKEYLIASGIQELWLAGFTNKSVGILKGGLFYFVLSNQMESTQKDKAIVWHLFKKQEDIHKRTSKV
jgi:hypothetical protein